MSPRSNRYKRGRSTSPLRSHYSSTSYGGCAPAPRPPGIQPPPPYGPSPNGYQETLVRRYRRDSSPLRHDTITKGCLCVPLIFLIIVAQFVAFIFFYDLPTKLDSYNKATARMHEQQEAMKREAKHLESERIALRGESNRLEKERLAYESATLEMEGKRDALESAIRRSEQERSRFERERQLLGEERHLLKSEKEALKEERERLEKAREDRFPQGAFWEVVWPAWDCRAYGKREYWGMLRNIPEDWDVLDACMNMPVEIKGVSVRRPYRCGYVDGSPHIHAYWMVDWDQPDCKPWYQDFHDQGCTNRGSRVRRIEAQIVGIPTKGDQDWRLLCESTPMTWNHVTYSSPAHCDEREHGRKVAMWEIPDERC